jgi:serine/threonine protein kinase
LERVQSLQNKHLIKLIATCTKKPLFYFIFPWADGGNLKEFWRREDSKPRTPELILWSLQQMLGLVDGLKALHGQNIRHGDLKPQNILHFKKSDRETIQTGGKSMLVITDVGVSKFHKEMTILRHDGTAEKAATVSYEAPEAEPDRLQGLPRSRKYDMWSMGCIFLEFTIWIVYSYNAVRRFRGRRSAKGVPTTTAGTFFRHNERGAVEIHASVAMAIETLLQDTRCEHTALEDLIMLIKDHLLQVDVHQRAEATDLYERLAKIVRAAENNSAYLCKIIASPPLTPKFFRSRRDSNSSRTSSSDMSPSQDDSSDRSASSPNVSSFDES